MLGAPSLFMVFIIDEGSEFNAPITRIWELTQDDAAHKHASQISPKVTMEGENVLLDFGTKMPDGSVMRQKVKIAPLPPVGIVLEYVEGPLTGTKLMQYYVPKGNKTGITVVGHATSKMMPDDQLKGAVMRALEVLFNEDVENLKTFG
jgi:hypothetical protein